MYSSEREVADVLDNLGIHWEYEPVLFTLCTSKKGLVKEGFRPDFYLTDWDLYIEVTKALQRNTTRKNRKVRELKELRPDVQVELIYKVHFENLEARVLEILSNSDVARRPAHWALWKRSLGVLSLKEG